MSVSRTQFRLSVGNVGARFRPINPTPVFRVRVSADHRACSAKLRVTHFKSPQKRKGDPLQTTLERWSVPILFFPRCFASDALIDTLMNRKPSTRQNAPQSRKGGPFSGSLDPVVVSLR